MPTLQYKQPGEAQRQGLFVGLPRTNPTWRSQMNSKWMNVIFKSGESTFALTCASLAVKTYHSLAYLPSKHTTVSAMPYPRSSLASRAEALGSLDATASSTHRVACRSLAISTGSLGKVACLKSCSFLSPLIHGNCRSMQYFSNFVTTRSKDDVGLVLSSKSAHILAASSLL